MKSKSFIASVLLLFACAVTVSAQVDARAQETAGKEIKEVVRTIFQSLEKMDAEALFQSYSNSNDFILINTEGFMVNFQWAKNGHAEWFKSLSSLKITPAREEFRFLPGNVVLCAWQGKFELTLKTGQQLKIDHFGVTFVFSQMAGRWKVIYQHSSSLPPAPLEPRK